ncbi:SurA N-terminal domain-containing protein [Desulfuromonas sp. TF]|uniref:SurA N-terminal domain-containing protein n=1 Tax=Desulfuromonas sp. TF TaxID=1232410 RepID=UPI00041A3C61|nr:SurA N-terminal domain-containing protein [Desulfuromonas sp. TF]
MKRHFHTIAILLLLPGLAMATTAVSRIAAVVNSEIITTRQLDQEVSERVKGGNIPASQASALRQQVLSDLIEKTLLMQKADELRIKVAEDEIEEAINEVQKQNKLTREQLIEALQSEGMGYEKYRENLRQQILRYKLVGREVQARVEVTNREIRDYFRENIGKYRDEPFLRLSRITFPIPAKATTVQIEAIRGKAEAALNRLRQGEEFYPVLLSLTADQSAEGGDMGTFAEGELTSAFEKAVRNLKEGEISSMVETPAGFHILQVNEISAGKVRQFDSVKEEIRRILREQKTEERFKEWSQGLRKEAYIDIRL